MRNRLIVFAAITCLSPFGGTHAASEGALLPGNDMHTWGSPSFKSIPGYADQDGAVTALDASVVLQVAAGIIIIPDPSVEVIDVSGNGRVTAYDAALILRFVVGMIDCFPVDEDCGD